MVRYTPGLSGLPGALGDLTAEVSGDDQFATYESDDSRLQLLDRSSNILEHTLHKHCIHCPRLPLVALTDMM